MTCEVIHLVKSHCPVCRYTLSAPFFYGGKQPLATLGWPKTSAESFEMVRYSLDYRKCPRCTHIWNRDFSYEAIPYDKNPNRMFNNGGTWRGHLKNTIDNVLSRLPSNPTIIEIGSGDNHFIRGIAESLDGKGRFLGFDPNFSQMDAVGVEFYPRLFEPLEDMVIFEPDLLIMRHVLEHLADPAAFIDQLAWGGSLLKKPVIFFAETPCVDQVFNSKRLVDFFYEHPSQFTTQSFKTLLEHGGDVLSIDHGYGREVVYGFVKLSLPDSYRETADNSVSFFHEADVSRRNIRIQLTELATSGKKIAIWGGTGKAAAFIHQFSVNPSDFPLIVDSDKNKVGTYVPKTGQLIQHIDVLKSMAIDIVIIPAQWRAKDICLEILREGLSVYQILIEHEGRLVDFHKDVHPYQ
jgi:hypothetical protein